LAVLFVSACWATSALFVKLILASGEVSAPALAFWRDLTTFGLLLASIGLFRPSLLRVQRADVRWLAAMGGSLGIFHIFWNLGVYLNGAAVATVQQAAMPAIVAAVAWLVWRESLTWAKIAAILLTFAGTVLVSGLDVLGRSELSLGGLLVGLGIPVLYASWNLFGKQVRGRHNPFTVLLYAFAFATLALLPFQFFTPQPFPVSPLSLVWFAGLVGVATLTGFSVYTAALGRLPASVASILAMSEIAFVAVYAYLLLGERLTLSQIAGAALVVIGVLLLSWQRWRMRAVRRQETGSLTI
jgi:drug/metabolite transporter (DMT)-like permease